MRLTLWDFFQNLRSCGLLLFDVEEEKNQGRRDGSAVKNVCALLLERKEVLFSATKLGGSQLRTPAPGHLMPPPASQALYSRAQTLTQTHMHTIKKLKLRH